MNKKLEVKNLQISFRTQGGILKAVRDVSFDVYQGETFAIVGESGSGKSVTSKAIMGILAGNSIVENGEILYDGQDLLKISEEDFHKIRGDKIAMIFQDPLSSLNPIMRIGQQLTEAMILKAKTGKRNARNEFNTKLKLLKENIDEANANNPDYDPQNTKFMISTFDKFCIESTKIERAYNDAYGTTIELELDIDNLQFLISKKQPVDVLKNVKHFIKTMDECINPYVVIKDEKFEQIKQALNSYVENHKEENADEKVLEVVNELKGLLHEASLKSAPNFFRLGYYVFKNPTADVSSFSIKELDEMTGKFLDEDFMLDFIKLAMQGVENSHKKSIAVKETALVHIDEIEKCFVDDKIVSNDYKPLINELVHLVNNGIDHLIVKKNSTEYVFHSAIRSAINTYYQGLKKNPKEQARFDKESAKHQRIIDKGKTPEWEVTPLSLVDMELVIINIRKTIDNITNIIKHDIKHQNDFDAHDEVLQIIDFMKDQASKVVVKMSKKIAKAKALKLMDEVGIPDPNIRFNQYPFEFSGGMRQRIVIAIALSANPDILICDEPTTALDVTIQSQILELINRIKAERNLSVIFITHNLGVVANMADRIAVMYAGKIVEYGKSEEIFYDPRHPYTWALLSSMPDLFTKEKLDSIPGTPPNMIYPPKGDAFADRNKYALEIDYEMQPPMFEVTDTHYAATWLLHPNAPVVERPKIISERINRIKKEMNN